MPRLTGRGWVVLVGAVVAYAAGEWAGFPLLRAMAGAAFGAVLAALVVTARRPRVAVTREVYPDRVERGRPAFARLRVHNASGRRHGGFIAGDRIDGGFHAVSVRPLAPGAEAAYHYELPTKKRGRFEVGPLTLERVDPLGLGRSRLTTGDTATMWVHPRTYPVRALVSGHPRHHHEGRTTDESLHGSLDLRDVREYVPGDEVRHLHWKATARTGRLMVRDYVDPNQPRFTALLDSRADLVPPQVLEEAVDLTASLMRAAAADGYWCRLLTTSGVDLKLGGGQQTVRHLLDELCELSPVTGGALVPVELTRGPDRGGSLVVVLASARQDDLTAIAALRPHYASTVVITIAGGADTGVPVRIPGTRVIQAPNAKGGTRRWNVAALR
ncbi:DUF58 domain-containing protein [Actinophytocola algeriensis]|uniref:Uncharacterized protein (DUF58 family) n=1 Tax=Actinophytocola algeriensis TaxID=1768010 RepID=A0A7W7VDR2_9PSEU|nr:DUF58 domain-containing protein [Actinophytocola algeriensis]MBB4906432.1 uncharacterized protein (DUF58 family) [Actinophytocola algeriensis]MBE1477913.1 uncharacterized protein (DUF58 family) [Actinophytocola algeriensis]